MRKKMFVVFAAMVVAFLFACSCGTVSTAVIKTKATEKKPTQHGIVDDGIDSFFLFGQYSSVYSFSITVDHSTSIEKLITDGNYAYAEQLEAGNYSYTSDYSEEPPVEKFVFVYCPRHEEKITTEQIINALNKSGQRPATFRELLAFGAKYPWVQEELRIVALRAVVFFPEQDIVTWATPYLGRFYLNQFYSRGRSMQFDYYSDRRGWNRDTCFLAGWK